MKIKTLFSAKNPINRLFKLLLEIPKYIILFFISIYQKTLSPDHGVYRHLFPNGYCRFHPTCSEYCKQSILKKGLCIGLLKTTWRVLRCNPWNGGGVDLP